MKNIKIYQLVIINLILFIIIFLNLKGCSQEKKYLFERKYEYCSLLLDKVCIKHLDSNVTPVFNSPIPNIIVRNEEKNIDKIKLYDFNMHELYSFSIKIENNLNPIYIMKDTVFTVDKKQQLYINNIKQLALKELKISSLEKLENNNYYAIGEKLLDNVYVYGFFLINKAFKSPILVYSIEKNRTSKYGECVLKYSGQFSRSIDDGNTLQYNSGKSSNIWIFRGDSLLSHFNTDDNTPIPNIINNGEFLTYDKGNMFNTNITSFIYKNKVHIFSGRSENKNKTLVDVYSINGKYNYSYLVPNINKPSQEISKIFIKGKNLLISYNDNCFSKLSLP